jgi:hypothetical protein
MAKLLMSLLVGMTFGGAVCGARGQSGAPKLVAPGVWFLLGDAHAGYCNTIVIEMEL